LWKNSHSVYEQIELQAKLLNYFLGSNKSNINQSGLLRTNTVAAKRNLLAERTGLGKSVSVSLRKNGPQSTTIEFLGGGAKKQRGNTEEWRQV